MYTPGRVCSKAACAAPIGVSIQPVLSREVSGLQQLVFHLDVSVALCALLPARCILGDHRYLLQGNRSCIGVAGIEHVSAGVLDQKLGLAYFGESLLYCPDLFVLVRLQYHFPPGLEASNLIQQGCPGLETEVEEGGEEVSLRGFLSWVGGGGGIGAFQNRTGCIEQAPCDFLSLYLPEAFMEIFLQLYT